MEVKCKILEVSIYGISEWYYETELIKNPQNPNENLLRTTQKKLEQPMVNLHFRGEIENVNMQAGEHYTDGFNLFVVTSTVGTTAQITNVSHVLTFEAPTNLYLVPESLID